MLKEGSLDFGEIYFGNYWSNPCNNESDSGDTENRCRPNVWKYKMHTQRIFHLLIEANLTVQKKWKKHFQKPAFGLNHTHRPTWWRYTSWHWSKGWKQVEQHRHVNLKSLVQVKVTATSAMRRVARACGVTNKMKNLTFNDLRHKELFITQMSERRQKWQLKEVSNNFICRTCLILKTRYPWFSVPFWHQLVNP